MPRRSSARDRPRKRYTVDAFEGIEGLQDDASEAPEPSRGGASDSGDEFEAEAEPGDEENDDDDDEMSGFDGEVEMLSEGASDAGEYDFNDGLSIAEDEDELDGPPRRGGSRPQRPKPPDPNDPSTKHNRGVSEGIRMKGGKFSKQLFYVGPEDEAYAAFLKGREQWVGEDTLPASREPDESGAGGFHGSFYQSKAERKQEAEEGWRWYFEEGGRERLAERQESAVVGADDCLDYMPNGAGMSRSFLVGPIKSPNLLKLQVGESVSLREAWQLPQQKGFTSIQSSAASSRAGFILNVGAKVRCLEWVPNQPSVSARSSTSPQFLAATVMPYRSDVPVGAAPAFTPSRPYPSSVQIWRFDTTPSRSLDADSPPVLDTVLCADWGDVKALRWCPISRKATKKSEQHLGLLAGIWSDGGLRVLDVQKNPNTSPIYTRIETAAFTAHPPATVFTSLAWLSSTRIAASCANGCIAIFDLAASLSPNVRPVAYFSAATTYILSLSAALPSRPYLLFTTAADGFARMTDLRVPPSPSFTSTIQSNRGRSPQDMVLWHDFCQSAITIDDNFALKAMPARKFFTSVAIARAKSAGTACATSGFHPFILAGTADGEVFGTNPMRRLLDARHQSVLQTWFTHEWRRPTPAETSTSTNSASTSEAAATEAGRIGANGLSRFVEGHKLEAASRLYREGNLPVQQDNDHAVHFHTIYEEETAVTALAWNCNREFAGWAAAGMGDGLMRVEDLVPQ